MNNDTPQESLRLSSEPYVIALDNENSDLITPVLDQHGDLKIAKKRKWDFPTIEVTSYKDGMVQLKATSDKESYIISVLVEKDKLHISCSCNQPVEKLCRHAYATLQKISYNYHGNSYFKQYHQNGLATIAQTHKHLFKTSKISSGLRIDPQPALGTIFKLHEKKPLERFHKILDLPVADKNQDKDQAATALCYLMMFGRRKGLPYLIPAEAVLNKDATAVKGFTKYIQTMQPPVPAGHEVIFEKCFRQIELVKKCEDSIWVSLKNHLDELTELFDTWQQLLPMIKYQPFVFRNWRWIWRMLNKKPRKGDVEAVHISIHNPVIEFELIERKEFYQLHIKISANGKPVSKYETYPRFFIIANNQLYVYSFLRDAAIAELMNAVKGFITIFKENYDEFEQQVLFRLSDAYFIKNYSENH